MNFALEGDTSGQISLQQLTHRLLQENQATKGQSAEAAEQAMQKAQALAQIQSRPPKQISADDLAASYNIMKQQVDQAQQTSQELFATAFKGAKGVATSPSPGMPDVTQPISLTSLLASGAQQ